MFGPALYNSYYAPRRRPAPVRLMTSVALAAVVAMAVQFAPKPHMGIQPDMWSELTSPVQQVMSIQMPVWQTGQMTSTYKPMSQRPELLNSLLDDAAAALSADNSGDLVRMASFVKSEQNKLNQQSLQVAYGNLLKVNAVLAQTAEQAAAQNDPQSMSRYYGLHTVMLQVALHMHEDVYFRLRKEDLPKILSMGSRAAYAYQEAEQLLATATDEATRTRLQQNMQQLEGTLATLTTQRRQIEGQLQQINTAWKMLDSEYRVAMNTWRTASLTRDAVAQIKSTSKTLQAVQDIALHSAVALPESTPRAEKSL